MDPQAGDVTGPQGREQLDLKVMGVLVMLAESAGKVVSREELLTKLWPDVVLSDDALVTLEKKLAEMSNHPEREAYTWDLRTEMKLSPFLKPLHAVPRWTLMVKTSS